MNVDEFYNSQRVLISKKRILRNFDEIYKICKNEMECEFPDFSVKNISNKGMVAKIPKSQSIHNKSETGQIYKGLIKAFADEYNNRINKQKNKGKPTSDWISEIPSPKHRILVRAMEAELKNLKTELREIFPPKAVITVNDYPVEKDAKLNDLERVALAYLISPDFLNKWKFSTGERAEVIDLSGNVVFKIATIHAIEKALRIL